MVVAATISPKTKNCLQVYIYILYYTTFQTIPLRDMLPSTAEALNDEEQGKADVHLQT